MLKNRCNRLMYLKELKVVSIAVIVLSVLVAVTLSASAAPCADRFGVEDANGYKNTNVTVPVNLTNPQNGPIYGIKFNLSYNRNVINVTDYAKGTVLTPNFFITLGYVEEGIAVTIFTFEDPGIIDSTNGSVTLLNFSVLGEPGETSYMNLSGIQLSNETGKWGSAPLQNGTFTVGGAQAWYLHSDTKMYKGNMFKPAGTVTISNGDTKNWTANEAATVDVKFPVGNWTGWLTLNATFATDDNFTVAVGSFNTTTSVFSSAGTQKFISDGSAKAFLDIPANEFTVPKGNNLSLQVSNSSTTLVIKTGAGNSFITSPETDPGYPVPELNTTLLFSVGLLALAAYILRPRFLKR